MKCVNVIFCSMNRLELIAINNLCIIKLIHLEFMYHENNKGKIVFHEDSASSRIALYNCTIDSDIFTGGRYYKISQFIKQMKDHS